MIRVKFSPETIENLDYERYQTSEPKSSAEEGGIVYCERLKS